MFDIDDTDLPVSGMSFARSSDMVVGQVVQIEPTSALVSGTLQPLNTNHVRLMKTWMTAKVASTANAETFTYTVCGTRCTNFRRMEPTPRSSRAS